MRKELKIIYDVHSFINGSIDVQSLIKSLEDFEKILKEPEELKQLADLIFKIKYELTYNSSNSKEDQIVINSEIKRIEAIIKSNKNLKKERIENLNKEINELKLEKITLKNTIIDLIEDNSLYQKIAMSMSPKELMDFSTSHIGGIVPPVSEELLDKMVDEAIKSNSLEKVWRIAMNYDRFLDDKTKLVDFVIKKGDPFYIIEMADANMREIDIDKLADAIIKTNDVENVISFLVNVAYVFGFNVNHRKKLEKAIKDLNGWEKYQNYINRKK